MLKIDRVKRSLISRNEDFGVGIQRTSKIYTDIIIRDCAEGELLTASCEYSSFSLLPNEIYLYIGNMVVDKMIPRAALESFKLWCLIDMRKEFSQSTRIQTPLIFISMSPP